MSMLLHFSAATAASSCSSFLPPSPPPMIIRRRLLGPSPKIRMDSSSFSLSAAAYNNSVSPSASSSLLTTEVEEEEECATQKLEKVLVVMGTTGAGKSKLSVDLSTTSGFDTEIVNCDKIHIYKGLDITTNKITLEEQKGVPHHLIGEFEGYFTPYQFRLAAQTAVSDISARGKLPVVVGCSNSFIHALVADRFHPGFDAFAGAEALNRIARKLRYDTCFIWLDVAFPVLFEYLRRRVDKLLEAGMVKELEEFYSSEWAASQTGLREAICVPEFEEYFKLVKDGNTSEVEKRRVYEEAVKEIKDNTCHLAERQLEKIQRLKGCGWDLHRVDATNAVKMTMLSPVLGEEVWQMEVVEPSAKIVKSFLDA
ncbi:Adenylate isopentenyltransferase [Linum grandiflorum]